MSTARPPNPRASSVIQQLPLAEFDDLLTPSEPYPSEPYIPDQASLTTRARLECLLAGDLEFHGAKSSYASHDLHAFAAKFPPQLPRTFIRGLTHPGERVLDPMMGSGTVVVEALLEGRHGIGLDIDPLALLLTRAKTRPLALQGLHQSAHAVLVNAKALLTEEERIAQALTMRFDDPTKAFLDYWFLPATQRELMVLILAIGEVADPLLRRFLELTFSSIIVTKSGGVSLARDLAHSRPHRDNTKTPKNALEQFTLRLNKNLASLAQLKVEGAPAAAFAGDARAMPLADGVIDLIVTSPPYANAIDYMRAHKFSLVWFGRSISELSSLRSQYIGSERAGALPTLGLSDQPESIISQLAARDRGKAAILRKYFVEMQMVFAEMYRVLRPDAAAVVVVGTSTMRGLDIQTHCCLADIAVTCGFDLVGIAERKLDRNRRMMPARFGKKSDSMIEQRMHEEYIIGLLKPGNEQGVCNDVA